MVETPVWHLRLFGQRLELPNSQGLATSPVDIAYLKEWNEYQEVLTITAQNVAGTTFRCYEAPRCG